VVVVHGPPRAELGLGLLDPAALVDAPARDARLPPHTFVADPRDVLERGAGQPGEPRAHEPDSRTSSVASGRARKRNGTNVVPRPAETCSAPPGSGYRPRT